MFKASALISALINIVLCFGFIAGIVSFKYDKYDLKFHEINASGYYCAAICVTFIVGYSTALIYSSINVMTARADIVTLNVFYFNKYSFLILPIIIFYVHYTKRQEILKLLNHAIRIYIKIASLNNNKSTNKFFIELCIYILKVITTVVGFLFLSCYAELSNFEGKHFSTIFYIFPVVTITASEALHYGGLLVQVYFFKLINSSIKNIEWLLEKNQYKRIRKRNLSVTDNIEKNCLINDIEEVGFCLQHLYMIAHQYNSIFMIQALFYIFFIFSHIVSFVRIWFGINKTNKIKTYNTYFINSYFIST